MPDFAVGANLPWLDYGHDCGGNAWQPGAGLREDGEGSILGLDDRVFPDLDTARGCSLRPRSILEMAREAGYSGALAWSALAEDRATDAASCHEAIKGFRSPGAPASRTA